MNDNRHEWPMSHIMNHVMQFLNATLSETNKMEGFQSYWKQREGIQWLMMEEEGNRGRWKEIKNKENQNKAEEEEEDKLIPIILNDFFNSVKLACNHLIDKETDFQRV